jgi:hypothetical protein
MIPTGGVYFGARWMGELEIAGLLEAARKLRPGAARHEALKEIGRLRIRLDAVATKLRK